MIRSFAAFKAKQKLKLFSYEQKPVGPWGVRIRVTHCGICHSDIHLIDNDWGISKFPLVPGHEVVGEVLELGNQAKHLNVGERVGVGWQAGSCMKCVWCRQGDENLCPDSRATCIGNYGGYGEEIQVDSRFAFPIPNNLSSEGAAPLLCGGVTVFSPFRHFDVKKGTKVGVLGIGGLGHLAVQFARALGAEVAAFSSHPEKEREVKEMGAERFVIISNKNQMKKAEQSLDFLLSTVNANLNWETYLNLVKKRGTLCFVGAVPGRIQFPVFSLIASERNVSGSMIGSRKTIATMLDFSVRHKIEAQTEVLRLSEVNQAIQKVRKNKARYRMVLSIT